MWADRMAVALVLVLAEEDGPTVAFDPRAIVSFGCPPTSIC